jgi:hypothetical protein
VTIIGIVLLLVGLVIALAGGIWLLVIAFRASVWWGLGSIFVPFVSLIFVITHWEVAKRPFLVSVAGSILLIVGAALGGAGFSSQPR